MRAACLVESLARRKLPVEAKPLTVPEGPTSCDWRQVFLALLLLFHSLSYPKEGRRCLLPAPPAPCIHWPPGWVIRKEFLRVKTTELSTCADGKRLKGHSGTQ